MSLAKSASFIALGLLMPLSVSPPPPLNQGGAAHLDLPQLSAEDRVVIANISLATDLQDQLDLDKTEVVLLLWPSEREMSSQAVNDPAGYRPVDSGTFDSNGRVQLGISSADAREIVRSGEIHDVDVWVSDGTLVHSTVFSIVPLEESSVAGGNRSGHAGSIADDSVSADQASLSTALSARPADVELGAASADHNAEVDEMRDSPLAVSAAAADGYNWGYCPGGPGLKYNYGLRWVLVGSTHIAATGKSMRFSYNSGATSTLGTAVSASGAFGSFTSSSNVSRSRQVGVTFPNYSTTGHRYHDTQYTYGRYCVEAYIAGHFFHQYRAQAISHQGGARTRNTTAPSSANYCTSWQAGSSGFQTRSTAQAWSNGADLNGAIGIGLYSRTGYTSSARLDYSFTTAGRACGTHGLPAGTPGRIVLRAP